MKDWLNSTSGIITAMIGAIATIVSACISRAEKAKEKANAKAAGDDSATGNTQVDTSDAATTDTAHPETDIPHAETPKASNKVAPAFFAAGLAVFFAGAILCVIAFTHPSSSANPPLTEPTAAEEETTDGPKTFSGDWTPPRAPQIIPALRRNIQQVNDWVYFLYPIKEDLGTVKIIYTALYRCREDESALSLVSEGKCDDYQIASDSVYYICRNLAGYAGELCVSRTDGLAREVLADDIDKFQIVDDYIFFTYSTQSGPVIDNHALHRMDLDGTHTMIVAYEAQGSGIGKRGVHPDSNLRHDFSTDGKYVYGENYKMELGFPADGTEKLIVTSPALDGYDVEWIYYVTNMLIKAKRDGSNQMILDRGLHINDDGIISGDGLSNVFLVLEPVDKNSDWLYYDFYIDGESYRIRKDGTGKEQQPSF